jgi:hypothetical protein
MVELEWQMASFLSLQCFLNFIAINFSPIDLQLSQQSFMFLLGLHKSAAAAQSLLSSTTHNFLFVHKSAPELATHGSDKTSSAGRLKTSDPFSDD